MPQAIFTAVAACWIWAGERMDKGFVAMRRNPGGQRPPPGAVCDARFYRCKPFGRMRG